MVTCKECDAKERALEEERKVAASIIEQQMGRSSHGAAEAFEKAHILEQEIENGDALEALFWVQEDTRVHGSDIRVRVGGGSLRGEVSRVGVQAPLLEVPCLPQEAEPADSSEGCPIALLGKAKRPKRPWSAKLVALPASTLSRNRQLQRGAGCGRCKRHQRHRNSQGR